MSMSDRIGKRVHVVPTSLDYDRITKMFEERIPDRVYILWNKEPIPEHEDINSETLKQVKSIVEEKTMCRERNELREVGINFYRFDQALIESYRLIYTESIQGNEVIVNLSGGTKPVAIALAFACSLNNTGQPVYYVAKNYEKRDGMVASSGVVDISSEIAPLNILNISDIMPTDRIKQDILVYLLGIEEKIGITELLVRTGEITKDPPDEEDDRSARDRTIQKYHRHANQLADDGVLQKFGSNYQLSNTGNMIARLVQVRREVNDGQTSLDDYK